MRDPLEQDFQRLFAGKSSTDAVDPMWQQLEIDLKKREFFRFAFSRFNVYYASMILLSLGISACALFKHSQENPQIVREHTLLQHTIDTVYLEKRIYIEKEHSENVFNEPITHVEVKQVKVDESLSLHTVKEEQTSDEDSTSTIKAHKTTDVENGYEIHPYQVQEEREPVIVHVQDTIVEIDSVKVSRRKMKKLYD